MQRSGNHLLWFVCPRPPLWACEDGIKVLVNKDEAAQIWKFWVCDVCLWGTLCL